MEKKHGSHTIAVNSAERRALSFCHEDEPYDQKELQHDHHCTSNESPLFSHCTKNEIGVLLRYKIVFRLSALQISFTGKASRADGDFRLVHIVTLIFEIHFATSEKNIDPDLLVRFHVFVNVICTEDNHAGGGTNEQSDQYVFKITFVEQHGNQRECDDDDVEIKSVHEQGQNEQNGSEYTNDQVIHGKSFP